MVLHNASKFRKSSAKILNHGDPWRICNDCNNLKINILRSWRFTAKCLLMGSIPITRIDLSRDF